jgi:hypothetical protein
MKRASDLTREQLERIVDTAQRALWQESVSEADFTSAPGDPEVWNCDTEWSWERVEEIAGALTAADLRPPEC